MKKPFIYFLTFIIMFAFVGLSVLVYINNSKASTLPAVFILPHQDDEMFCLGAIIQHVRLGRDVRVVLATDGKDTKAITKIKTRLNTTNVSKASQITTSDIYNSRIAEFTSSLTKAGVQKDHIYFAMQEQNLLAKGYNNSVDEANSKLLIDYYVNKLGNGDYKGIAVGSGDVYSTGSANLDQDPHNHIFAALRDKKGLKSKRFYVDVKNKYSKAVDVTNAQVSYSPVTHENLLPKIAESLSSYKVWDPANGRLAVGYTSVPAEINKWSTNKYEYIITTIK